MVFEIIRLWFHTTVYSQKDKHKSQCSIKKRSHRHHRRQQKCTNAQGWNVDKKIDNSRDKDDTKKPSGRRNHSIRRNTTKWNKRTRSIQRTGEGRWTIMGREWNCLCGQMNLCAKQSKYQGKNTERKPWTSGYRIPGTTTDDGTHQEKLLVARNQEWYQEICLRMFQMPTK